MVTSKESEEARNEHSCPGEITLEEGMRIVYYKPCTRQYILDQISLETSRNDQFKQFMSECNKV